MSRLEFEKQLAIGREVEMAVARWLMQRGHRVLPVYDYSGLNSGKAPKLQAISSADSLICPDLLIVKGGRTIWCEVKFKTHADFTRRTRQHETGIDLRLWNHYQQVADTSGSPVWLIFCHQCEDEIRCGSLDVLRSPNEHRIYRGSKMSHSGMVFFRYDTLHYLERLSSVIRKS